MSFWENTRKPVGLGGKLMVSLMNLGHSPVAWWGLRFLNVAPDAKVLDCGCGGGANIKRLLKKCPQGIVKGIDYSPVSVEKSQRVNADAIAKGRCTILQGSVAKRIFAEGWFDAVTAFETVYFWPELPQCFHEIHRMLKPGGMFLICNESSGDTDRIYIDRYLAAAMKQLVYQCLLAGLINTLGQILHLLVTILIQKLRHLRVKLSLSQFQAEMTLDHITPSA